MMYYFAYYFIYKISIKKKSRCERYCGSGDFDVANFHTFIVILALMKLNFIKLPSLETTFEKVIYLIIALIPISLFISHLKNRFMFLQDKYDDIYPEEKLYSLSNYIKLTLIFLIPVVLIIYLAPKAT